MNGVKFVFSYKIEEHGGRGWISRIDLSKLVDPVLRPTYIANAGDFRTVIIDPGHGRPISPAPRIESRRECVVFLGNRSSTGFSCGRSSRQCLGRV